MRYSLCGHFDPGATVWSSRCCCPAGPGLHEDVAPVVGVGEGEDAGEGALHVVAVAVVDTGEDECAGEGVPRVVPVDVVDAGEDEGAGEGAPHAVAVAVVDAGDDEGAGEGAPHAVSVAVVDAGEGEGAGEGASFAVAVAVAFDTSLLLDSGACRQQAVAVVWYILWHRACSPPVVGGPAEGTVVVDVDGAVDWDVGHSLSWCLLSLDLSALFPVCFSCFHFPFCCCSFPCCCA